MKNNNFLSKLFGVIAYFFILPTMVGAMTFFTSVSAGDGAGIRYGFLFCLVNIGIAALFGLLSKKFQPKKTEEKPKNINISEKNLKPKHKKNKTKNKNKSAVKIRKQKRNRRKK